MSVLTNRIVKLVPPAELRLSALAAVVRALGPVGLARFLETEAAASGEYAVGRDPWRPKFESLEALLAEIARFEAGEPVAVPSEAELAAVLREHGPLAYARIIQYYGLGSGDYVKDREAWRPKYDSVEELFADLKESKVSQEPAGGG